MTLIAADRAAGFFPKSASGVATGGFGSGDIRGRVETFKVGEES